MQLNQLVSKTVEHNEYHSCKWCQGRIFVRFSNFQQLLRRFYVSFHIFHNKRINREKIYRKRNLADSSKGRTFTDTFL